MIRLRCMQPQLCHETRLRASPNAAQPAWLATKSNPFKYGLNTARYAHSIYVDTLPPTKLQAEIAETFFRTHLPIKSWTATEWRKQPHSETAFLTPEIAFLGRSNSGKSSLLNALLLNQELCRVGPKPGKTTTMHAWSLGPWNSTTKGAKRGFKGDVESKLTVLDMPGYGHGSRGDWGRDIMKYLTSRKQLRRAFVLVNPEHGLKTQDIHMLQLLRGHGIPHQLIATKCDRNSARLLPELMHNLQLSVPAENESGSPVLAVISDILATGGLGDGKANKNVNMKKMAGLGDVRWAILRAAGLEDYATTVYHGGVKAVKHEAQTKTDPLEPAESMESLSELDTESPGSTLRGHSPTIGLSVEDFMASITADTSGSRGEEVERVSSEVVSVSKRGGRIRPRSGSSTRSRRHS